MSQVGILGSGTSSPTVLFLEGNSGGEVGPNGSGVIFVVGSGGVTVAGNPGTDTLTISVGGGGFTWNDEAISFPALAENGYFCTAALTAALPASPNQGDTIIITTTTASTVLVLANTGQKIYNGDVSSSVAGTISASAIGNSITLVYRAADSTWRSISTNGTWGAA